MNRLLLLMVLSLFLGIACDQNTKKAGANSEEEAKEAGVLKQYWPNGNLMVEQEVKDGKRNGMSRKYYETGIINTETPYVDNKREGVSKFYYESGKLYRASTYKDDELNGPRKKYYQGGELMSEQSYLNGFPGADLKEYSSLGELRNEKYGLSVKKKSRGSAYIIEASLNKNNDKARFYIGVPSEKIFMNEELEEMISVGDGAVGEIQKDMLAEGTSVIAVIKSRQKNDLILIEKL